MNKNIITALSAALFLAPAALAEAAPSMKIVRAASQPARSGPAENFTGTVRVTPFFESGEPDGMSAAAVAFERGARSAWHKHPGGQLLIVTEGKGLVQERGERPQTVRAGDVIWTPPETEHWHGASADAEMTHTSIVRKVAGKTVEWLEKPAPEIAAKAPEAAKGTTRAQALMGDVAPKLAELTDDVLFGDVWERPGLSKRDRSLATVSALIALNRPDQLRSHLALARENGVTREELVEVITHLAFYSGWPNAVTAVSVAREVFEKK